jgi:hypothetical protein
VADTLLLATAAVFDKGTGGGTIPEAEVLRDGGTIQENTKSKTNASHRRQVRSCARQFDVLFKP